MAQSLDIAKPAARDQHSTQAAPPTSPDVRSTINRRRGQLALSGLLSLLGNAAGLAPFLVIYFIAVEILGKPLAEVNSGWLWTLAGLALAAVLLKAVGTGMALHVSHIAAYTILYDLRIALAEHMARLPLGYFSTRTTGQIKKVIHEDVEQMEEGLAHMVPDLVGGLTVPILTAIVLFIVDWRLALATIALLPFALGMYGWVAARSGIATYNAINGRINAAVIQYINGMKVLKTFLRADASFEKLRAVSEEMRAYYTGPYAASAPALAVIFAVVRANLLLIVPLGVLFYLGGTLDISTFVLFLVLGMGFNRPIWTLFTSYSTAAWQVNQASKNINALLRTPPLSEPAQPQTPRDASIVFDNVSFSYVEELGTENQEAALVLNNVSFTMPAGSVTALVGPSGAGKSTIAKLIPRFWDVTKGQILVGGADVRQIGTARLMDQVAFVFQDVFLFNDSVAANIRAGKPNASDAEVEAAAQVARCHAFILELPQGYDTPVGENGSRLSGGQRQRLSIARAILKDAPIVVLDEATAFLDPENEAQVQAALAALVAAGKTVVMIAHRLSTITDVDQILVVDGGRIVARGTHSDLLQQSPLYKELWDAHMASQEWQLRKDEGGRMKDEGSLQPARSSSFIPHASSFTNPYTDLNPDESLMRTMLKLVPGQRKAYLRGIAWKVLDGMVSAWPAIIVFLILVELFQQPINTGRIWLYVGVLGALFVAQIGFNYMVQRTMLGVVASMHFDLRLFLADYLRRLPLGFFTRRDTGTIDSLFTTNITFLDVRFPTDMFIAGVVAPSILFVTMLFIDWRLALAAGIGVPVALLILRGAIRVFAQIWSDLRIARTAANSRMVEYIQGIGVIRAFNLAGTRMGQFSRAIADYRDASMATTTRISPAMIGFMAALETGFAVLIAAAVWLFLGGNLDGVTFLLFLFLGLAFYQPLLLLGELQAFERIIANSVRNLNEFLKTPTLPEAQQGQQPVGHGIAFEDVHFRYDERPVLNGVTCNIPERGITALVGPSGSGKTTITSLIARFWDVSSGTLRVGGVDVRAMDTATLQSQLTMVFQDVYLFNDTIRANIAMGKPDASDAEIEAAARSARCHDFIAALPNGYNTMVGEGGATLSGGEKQRISIARALLKNAPIVLLDEATASIDPENEWLIQQAFDVLAAEKTVIVIAHRLATLQRADQILVLDEGRLVQQGRHVELIAQEGMYRRFWQEREKARTWKLGAVQPVTNSR
ncbi:MAG: ABC transporter ATP-binding protein/permease [Chloroflexaceae bacterium]|nr:ABC transporter ATP-binding protein/permease [Chloroflexaceae bacterium]